MAKGDTHPQRPSVGKVAKGHAQWKQGVGRDRTDPRYHGYTAKGGPITRRMADEVTLVETSFVRCCEDVKPGKMCPHGVWGFEKVESP